jgi:16S rRNA (guanine527-N7)-methyltransferase
MVRPSPLRFSDTRPALDRWFAGLDASPHPPDTASAEPRAAIAKWLELLCSWNERIDLTAARNGDELVDLMLADALVMSRSFAPGTRVLDVGTGAGAPGLALALMRPDLVVTLCEPLAKRASFLRTVIGSLGRTDVTLVAKRGEDLAGERDWDEAMARATLPPEEWLALGAKLVKPGGGVWVLLATGDPPSRPGTAVTLDERYTWPATNVSRRAVRYEITG